MQHVLDKVPNREFLFVNREKGLFLSVYVDDIKPAGKKQNIHPMWKVLMEEVELGEPTSFLDHVHLGCTQRECETSKAKILRTITKICSNPGSLQEQKKSCLVQGDLMQTSQHGPMTWKVMQKKCVEQHCEVANQKTQQLYKVSTPCLDMTFNSKKKNWDLLENCQ